MIKERKKVPMDRSRKRLMITSNLKTCLADWRFDFGWGKLCGAAGSTF